MDIINQVGKSISSSSRAAVNKAQNMTEIIRINANIEGAQKTIDEHYISLGKAYKQKCQKNNEDIDNQIIKAIVELETKIAVWKSEITALKGAISCPACGYENKSGAGFCAKCGSSLATKALGDVVCPSCGAELDAETVFCIKCGCRVGQPQPVASSVCHCCGAALIPGNRFCTNCGAVIASADPETMAAAICTTTPVPSPVHEPTGTVPTPEPESMPTSKPMPKPEFLSDPVSKTDPEPGPASEVMVCEEPNVAPEPEAAEDPASVPEPAPVPVSSVPMAAPAPVFEKKIIEEINVAPESAVIEDSVPVSAYESVPEPVTKVDSNPVAVFEEEGLSRKSQIINAAIPDRRARTCNRCGAVMQTGLKYCTKCGLALGEPAPQEKPAPLKDDAPPVVASFCSYCGTKYMTGDSFCSNCGRSTNDSGERICPSCHAVVPDDYLFCPQCGRKI